MKTAGPILGIVLAAAVGACAKEKTQAAAAPPSPSQAQAMAAACPMAQIPGVQASVADINKGVAITFTGPQRSLDELRKNVHSMASANDKQGDAFAVCPCASTVPGGAAEAMPGTAPGGAAMMRAIPAKASVDEIETGAVLKLTAKDDSQIQALRTAAKQNVQALRQGCLSPQGQPNQQYQQQYPPPTQQYQPQSQQPSQQYPQPPPAAGQYGEPYQPYQPPQPTQQ